jgi:hypothetical protein
MTHADTAAGLVLGSRNDDYGNPHPDFAGIALMWSGLLNTKLNAQLTAVEVGLMMAALKLRRHAHKPKADNLIDAHGYLDCIEWIEAGVKPEPLAEILASKVSQLRQDIAQREQTIEDVACGARLQCPTCGKAMPCMCEHPPKTPLTPG